MSDDLDPLRRLRPDRLQPDDPLDPAVLTDERKRLMASIEGTIADLSIKPSPAVYPRLAYRDPAAAVDYLERVFGFREQRGLRQEHGDSLLAWVELGDGLVMISGAGEERHDIHSPLDIGHTSVMLIVYVDDVDAHHDRAVAAGARIVMPLEDMFWGDRRYEAVDPEGHRWHFGERLADVRRRRGEPEPEPER
jgi:uncharacterized glyoxalase superfamily protein PhnB